MLVGDPTKAREIRLGAKISLESLINEMMESDFELFKKDKYLREGGHDTLNYFE